MPSGRTRLLLRCAALAVVAFGAYLIFVLWGGAGEKIQPIKIPSSTVEPRSLSPEAEAAVAAFCGDCHALPRPDSFARDRWHEEVRFGYKAYARSGRIDLTPPPFQDTLLYYQSRAPEYLEFPVADPVDEQLRSNFSREPLDWGRENYTLPAISNVRWLPDEQEGPRLLVCDMSDGRVSALEFDGLARRRAVLAQFDHPCHVEPCDLDGDGQRDLLVAELGSLYPSDHDRGKVIWLRKNREGVSYTPLTIAEGLGRVADVRPMDADGDGDQDLIVAEFGHFRTGNIHLLRNITEKGAAPRFLLEEIDPRPGTIHVPVHDFNKDGRPDFVGLVSQEYEAVDLFLNQGNGKFLLQNIWTGPDLTFGSSGIELIDLDQDGDMDVLYTNGDSFDNTTANPTHGVQWLENMGGTDFAYHRLADLPGAYRALPADFDNDGDLDVIAVAFLPSRVIPKSLRVSTTVSILLLEQTMPGNFTSHTLECGTPNHAAFETGDFDADGDVDFVVSTHMFAHSVGPGTAIPGRLTIWWNRLVDSRP